jgi:glycosyltransferase involved in cell wall biosynthesis
VKRLGRALFLLPGADIGGAEAHTAWLARFLAASGLDPRFAIAAPLRDRFAALIGPRLAAGLDAAAIGWDTAESAAENARRQAEAAAKLIAAVRPDAAVLPLPWPTHGLGLQRALAAAGVPVLAVAHLAPVEPEPEGLAAARALRFGPTRWVAVSEPVAARLAGCFALPPGAVSVVPNGVDVPAEDPHRRAAARKEKRARVGLAGRAPLFVFAGRLEPNKGADLLPAMAERLHAATGGGGVAVLGGGKLLRGWESAPAPPRPGLHLLGHVPDVPDWLLAADALLLPSRLEGCPLVFLEAAARRCPVVATAAAVECFGDDAHAMAAVSQEGSAAAVADRALAALAEPVATRRRVEAAFRRAAAHDAAAMLRQYAGLLRAAVAP